MGGRELKPEEVNEGHVTYRYANATLFIAFIEFNSPVHTYDVF